MWGKPKKVKAIVDVNYEMVEAIVVNDKGVEVEDVGRALLL